MEKELKELEKLRVCELIDVWEVPMAWVNEGGVCVRRNDISLGLVSTTGRKNEKKSVKALALKDRLILCGRDEEKHLLMEECRGNVVDLSRPLSLSQQMIPLHQSLSKIQGRGNEVDFVRVH